MYLSTKNDWSREIGARIAKTKIASFAQSKFFKSKILSLRINVRLYTTIVKTILTCDFET